MQQTFYIDQDEEISSVIDRLRKSMSAENYFVVPSRALLIQSIVNLKLLKREADKSRKMVIIVTQDEIGINMAEKAGLIVKDSVEEVEIENGDKAEADGSLNTYLESEIENEWAEASPQEKQSRLKEIGSDGFFDSGMSKQKISPLVTEFSNEKRFSVKSTDSLAMGQKNVVSSPKTITPEGDLHIRRDESNKNIVLSGVAIKSKDQELKSQLQAQLRTQPKQAPRAELLAQRKWEEQKQKTRENFNYKNNLDPQKEANIEKMFREKEKSAQDNNMSTGKKSRKIIFSFIFLCLIAFSGVAIYLFLPGAEVDLTLENLKKKTDIMISGGENKTFSTQEKTIPIIVVEKESSISLSYNATGKSSTSGKKASGTVTIYNEYSIEPQQLISSTRLEAENGKIFRITKNIVVPGMVKIGSEIKPGAIKVAIIADEPGDEYNFEPTSFKIPGFKESPKYEKFYAKSTEKISGGSSDGSNIKAVSQQDIESARAKTEEELKVKLLDKIKSDLQPEEIADEKNSQFTFSEYMANAKVGEIKDSFEYTVKGKIVALVFSDKYVKNIAEELMKKEIDGNKYTDIKVSTSYSSFSPDFDAKSLSLGVNLETNAKVIFDVVKFKKDILGKEYKQAEAIIKQITGIKDANIDFFPAFVSKVSKYDFRVNIDVIYQ